MGFYAIVSREVLLAENSNDNFSTNFWNIIQEGEQVTRCFLLPEKYWHFKSSNFLTRSIGHMPFQLV